jgi:hypothetical protein
MELGHLTICNRDWIDLFSRVEEFKLVGDTTPNPPTMEFEIFLFAATYPATCLFRREYIGKEGLSELFTRWFRR